MIAAPDEPALSAARSFLRSFRKPAHLLAAVSGGSDSTGLLLSLHAVIDEFPGFTLSAATIDHGLRAGSGLEAEQVARFCASLGVAHEIRRWEGAKPAGGLQAAARMARYRLLADAARNMGADAIVTGHTRDDQAETVFMRAERNADPAGTGLAGMAGAVLFDRAIWILRPLLHVDRATIRAFLAQRNVSFIDDPSNLNPAFERVRVRQTTKGFATGDLEAAGRERSRLSGEGAAFLMQFVRLRGGLAAHAGTEGLAHLHEPACFRALLTLGAVLGGKPYLPGRETARRIRRFLTGDEPRMTAGRAVYDRRRDGLHLYREARGLPILELGPGETCDWDGRFRISNRLPDAVTLSTPADARTVVADLIAAGLPEPVAKRAARAAPSFRQGEALPKLFPDDVSVELLLSPFDTFLPCFDLALADAVAHLAGRAPYVSCPVHIV